MDFGNPKKLKFLTICILFRVLKRLEEEEGGGGWHIVTDFVTRLMISGIGSVRNLDFCLRMV